MSGTEQLDELIRIGLTHEEALLYLFLLDVKSATIRDIHTSQEFQSKLRPNLYKVINSLETKGFVREEVKDGRKRIFPEPPKEVLDRHVTEEEKRLEELRRVAPKLSRQLEDILLQPSRRFPQLPEEMRDFADIVNKKWFLNEIPEIRKIPMLGVTYSAEFHTHRRSGANTAGLVITEFRYPEHRDRAMNNVINFQKQEMGHALKNLKTHGAFQMKSFRFEERSIKVKSVPFRLRYAELHLKLSTLGEFKGGGTVTLRLKEYPTKLISAWASNHQDLRDLVTRIGLKFNVLPELPPNP